VLYGSLGFYLGTNIPSLSSSHTFSNSGSGPKTIALASATGTFVAAFAALVSVYMIIFDESRPFMWSVGIGSGWALGVLLQLAAGYSSAAWTVQQRPWLGLDRGCSSICWRIPDHPVGLNVRRPGRHSRITYRSHLSFKIRGLWMMPAASLFRPCFSRHFGPGPRI
jgi:hypothetical protein